MRTASAERRDEATTLRRKLDRAKAENQILENMIETTTRSLYEANGELRERKRQLEALLTSLSAAVIVTDGSGTITSVEGRAGDLIGRSSDECVGQPVERFLAIDRDSHPVTGPGRRPGAEGSGPEGSGSELDETWEGSIHGADGRSTPVVVACSSLTEGVVGAVYTAIDVSDRKRLEVELRHAQRLEAIGSLAAGVAHELNSPIQFVLDSVRFIADSLDDLMVVDEQHRALRELAHGLDGGAELVAAIEREEEIRDLDFTRQEFPGAVERAITGLHRVSSIVKAMRRFSHPGEDLVAADINQVVETAVTLAAHEYKYVADVDLELAPVPDVRCNKVDLSGVIVNLLINAADAIGDRHLGPDGRGTIRIATGTDGDGVRIDVADDGGGIPAEVRARVFEPFFTTKGPGKGTGQGLALAYETVVARHKGRLAFDVVDGVGTTFHIWLPVEQAA